MKYLSSHTMQSELPLPNATKDFYLHLYQKELAEVLPAHYPDLCLTIYLHQQPSGYLLCSEEHNACGILEYYLPTAAA
eukprot:Gb_30871 [translate_table: standard]